MDDDPSPTVATIIAAIEAEFGNRWGVWESDTAKWWAARHRALTTDEITAGCVPFLQADTPDELRQRIRDEEAPTRHAQKDSISRHVQQLVQTPGANPANLARRPMENNPAAAKPHRLSDFGRVHLESVRLATQVLLQLGEDDVINSCLQSELHTFCERVELALLLPARRRRHGSLRLRGRRAARIAADITGPPSGEVQDFEDVHLRRVLTAVRVLLDLGEGLIGSVLAMELAIFKDRVELAFLLPEHSGDMMPWRQLADGLAADIADARPRDDGTAV